MNNCVRKCSFKRINGLVVTFFMTFAGHVICMWIMEQNTYKSTFGHSFNTLEANLSSLHEITFNKNNTCCY